ncbi:MAG: hypothetical protein N2Z73_03675 [Endomicrobia bacterium]|nr:hypothetical protein [Endomicrobiia bacterium]
MTEKENLVFDTDDGEQQQQPQQETIQEQSVKSGEKTDFDKIKELEQLYQKRLQEIANKERELEPLIQLQQFLNENPDKAQKISEILVGNNIVPEKQNEINDILGTDTDEIKKLKQELEKIKNQIYNQQYSQQVDKEKQYIQQKISEYEKIYEFFDPHTFFSAMMSYPEDYLDKLSDTEYQKLMDTVAKQTAEYNKKKFEEKFNEYLKKKKEVAEKTKSETHPSPVATLKEQPEKITMDNAKSIAQKLLEKFLK